MSRKRNVIEAARTRSLVLAGLVVLAAACARHDEPVTIERAAVTLDVAGAPAVAYFTVRDEGARADTITGVTADRALHVSMQKAQAHRMPELGGAAAMLMLRVERVPMRAGEPVRFVPGGLTAVFEGVRGELAVADTVLLTVTLASGRTASVTAPVVAFSDLESALGPGDVAQALSGTPSLEEGAALYRANGCASCHGPEGRGDGALAPTLMPPPRDFRDTLAFKAGRDVQRISRMLATGVPGGGNMPLYAHLTNRERESVALLVISLRTSTPD